MRYGIRVLGVAGRVIVAEGDAIGAWVKHYNPDAFDGMGDVQLTHDAGEALTFDSQAQAMGAAFATSTVRPVRADGRANRPLTAFTLEVLPMPVEP